MITMLFSFTWSSTTSGVRARREAWLCRLIGRAQLHSWWTNCAVKVLNTVTQRLPPSRLHCRWVWRGEMGGPGSTLVIVALQLVSERPTASDVAEIAKLLEARPASGPTIRADASPGGEHDGSADMDVDNPVDSIPAPFRPIAARVDALVRGTVRVEPTCKGLQLEGGGTLGLDPLYDWRLVEGCVVVTGGEVLLAGMSKRRRRRRLSQARIRHRRLGAPTRKQTARTERGGGGLRSE